MMTSRNLRREDIAVVQRMVDTMVGIPRFSYPARQGGDRPKGEHAEIQWLVEYQDALPSTRTISVANGIEQQEVSCLARVRLRISLIDTNGLNASRILNGWTSEAMKAIMMETGYGFIKCDPIVNEDALLEREWEIRQAMSLELYVERKYTQEVDEFTGIFINGEVQEGSNKINTTIGVNT